MPIYDYVCTQCGRSIEVMHGINAPRPTTCEVCGGQLKKQISTPAIQFKGSGWAKRDARSSATRKAEAADSSPTGTSDSAGSDKPASGATATDSKGAESGSAAPSPSSSDTAGSKGTPEAKPAAKSTGNAGKDSASKASRTPGSSSPSGS